VVVSDDVMMMITLMTGWNVMKIMWKWKKVTQRVQKVLHWMVIAKINWRLLIVIFIGKDKTKQGKVKCSTYIPCRWQNILTKLPEVTGQARKATVPFETWNCLITNDILDNIVQHTNK